MSSIKIVQLQNGTVAFQPDIPGAKPGQPLGVDLGEHVTWNNETNQAHWPWPTDTQGNLLSEADAIARRFYLADDVPAGRVSKPIYNVDPQFSPPAPPDVPPPTITYVCKHHQQEQGSIVVRNA
jgi:hypothetical protein